MPGPSFLAFAVAERKRPPTVDAHRPRLRPADVSAMYQSDARSIVTSPAEPSAKDHVSELPDTVGHRITPGRRLRTSFASRGSWVRVPSSPPSTCRDDPLRNIPRIGRRLRDARQSARSPHALTPLRARVRRQEADAAPSEPDSIARSRSAQADLAQAVRGQRYIHGPVGLIAVVASIECQCSSRMAMLFAVLWLTRPVSTKPRTPLESHASFSTGR